MYLMQLLGTNWEPRFRYEFNLVDSEYAYSGGNRSIIPLDKSSEGMLE